jgi:hypothetical protein
LGSVATGSGASMPGSGVQRRPWSSAWQVGSGGACDVGSRRCWVGYGRFCTAGLATECTCVLPLVLLLGTRGGFVAPTVERPDPRGGRARSTRTVGCRCPLAGVGALAGWEAASLPSSFPLLGMVSVVELARYACCWPTLLALVVGSLFVELLVALLLAGRSSGWGWMRLLLVPCRILPPW